MKLIIAGSRDFQDEDIYAELVQLRISDHPMVNAEEIVSGCARGADTAGEMYADFYGISVKKFPADWNTHGKSAGPIRNKQMAEYADALLIFMKPGGTKGSLNMIKQMKQLNKQIWIYEV